MGFIAGAKLYYEFSGHRPYDEELQRLVQALKKMKQQLASQPADVAKPVRWHSMIMLVRARFDVTSVLFFSNMPL